MKASNERDSLTFTFKNRPRFCPLCGGRIFSQLMSESDKTLFKIQCTSELCSMNISTLRLEYAKGQEEHLGLLKVEYQR